MAEWRHVAAGVRFRTTAVAVVAVAVMLAVAVLAVGWAAGNRLEASTREAVETRAEDLAALAEAGATTGTLPGQGVDVFAQVIVGDSVVATSPDIAGLGPLVAERPGAGLQQVIEVEELFEELGDVDLFDDDGPFVLVIRGVATPDGQAVVLAGASLADAREALGAVQPLLWAGIPLVLAAVGLLVWWLTGRALQPVDAMRSEAASISATDPGRRLPEPESRDEVHALATTLNAMLDRLEEAAARQRRFVADASHELKTPVTSIRTMLDVVAEDPGFDDWEGLLADLGRENRRSEDLVRDLLVLAQADEGRALDQVTEIDVDQLVGAEVERVRRGAGVAFETTGILPAKLQGSRAGLGRLVRNLLDNAVRHAGSRVWVTCGVEQGHVVISVSDDGAGIPVAERERVFERFVRLDEARDRDSGGAGLGLAVARAVARSHGGDVRVIESLHGGATLEVRIPRDG